MFKHTRKKVLFVSALSLAALGVATIKPARAAPVLPTDPPITATPPVVPPTPDKEKAPHLLNNVTLDYDNATTNSAEFLNAKVSVKFDNASFLSALDAVMEASDKTCRIECRQLHSLRLSMNVQQMPILGLLDSLAELSGGRLYVLSTKLILAPETALTDDERKNAKAYGVLLTVATLPNTANATALTTPNAQGKSILDIANTKVSGNVKNMPLIRLLGGILGPSLEEGNTFHKLRIGPIELTDLEDRHLTFSVRDATFGETLASYAHLIGLELYLTPDLFLICSPDRLTDVSQPKITKMAVPALVPFSNPSANPS